MVAGASRRIAFPAGAGRKTPVIQLTRPHVKISDLYISAMDDAKPVVFRGNPLQDLRSSVPVPGNEAGYRTRSDGSVTKNEDAR